MASEYTEPENLKKPGIMNTESILNYGVKILEGDPITWLIRGYGEWPKGEKYVQ